MATTGLDYNSVSTESPADRVIDDRVLAPIPGPQPAGQDIRGLKLWVDLRAARPKPEDLADDHQWKQANAVQTDWPSYLELVEKALSTQSKDLELGIFLTEACARVYEFAGVRDGLWVIGGLISVFFHQGLLPEPEDGDLEIQYGKLAWLNEKLSDVIRELPLTRREEEPNYSLNYRDESRRQGGMITAAEFEAAASAGSTEEYSELLSAIEGARAELERLEAIIAEHYGSGVLSFHYTEETLDQCRVTVQSILRKRQPASTATGASDGASAPVSLPPSIGLAETTGAPSDAWSESERLARSGNVDRALASMAALAAAEPNGRVRFQRKLLLADLCLQTNRKKLGTSILQELNEIIELHKLESWETSEIVGGVWSRLVRCYRDKAAGTADESLEAEFFLKLSRLDPWQALACGEPARRD